MILIPNETKDYNYKFLDLDTISEEQELQCLGKFQKPKKSFDFINKLADYKKYVKNH